MSIGTVIREAREARGLRQSDLAIAVGVDERQIRRYEQDQVKDLKVARARRLATALGLPLDRLFVSPHEASVPQGSSAVGNPPGLAADVVSVGEEASPGSQNGA